MMEPSNVEEGVTSKSSRRTWLKLLGALGVALIFTWVVIAFVIISGRKEPESAPQPIPDLDAESENPPPLPPATTFTDRVGLGVVAQAPVSWFEMSVTVTNLQISHLEGLRQYVKKKIKNHDVDKAYLENFIKAAGMMRLRDVGILAWLEHVIGQNTPLLGAHSQVATCLILPGKAEALIPPLFTHEDPEIRALACEAAPFFKTEPWVQAPLENAVQDRVARVRASALMHLAKMESYSPEVIGTVVRISAVEKGASRAYCVKLLGVWGTEECYQAIVSACQSKSSEVREAAARALGVFDKPGSRELLLALVEDQHEAVRISAIQSLSAFGSRITSKAIVGKLGDGSVKVRLAVLKTLEFNPPGTMPAELSLTSRDASPDVRYALVVLLRVYPEREASRLLAMLLDDKDPGVGGKALEEVSRRRTKTMVVALLNKLETKVAHADRYFAALEALAGVKPWDEQKTHLLSRNDKIEAAKKWWKANQFTPVRVK